MDSSFSEWIVQETPGWIAVNKPPGISVECQPGAENTLEDLALSYLSSSTNKPFAGIVHRLDRPTSGLVLLAKKKSVLQAFHTLFREAKIRKTYLAVSNTAPEQKKGILEHWLIKDTLQKKALVVTQQHPGAALARLKYRVLMQKNHYFLWEIQLLSGKYHQIRAQLSSIDCPIVGDTLYGGKEIPMANTIALHARKLVFPDPLTGSQTALEASLPPVDFWEIWNFK